MAATFKGIRVSGVIRLTEVPTPAPADLYPQYTVLRLPGTGTNNTANNTFLDSSSNNFAITRFGNTTQGSFSPFSTQPGYWSNYFDGNQDFVEFANNVAFQFGSDSFTIEAWVNVGSYSALNTIASRYITPNNLSSPTITSWRLVINSSSSIDFEYRDSNGTTPRNVTFTGLSLKVNTWTHIALCRNSNNFTLYIDGTSAGTISQSFGINPGTSALRIGSEVAFGVSYNFLGYISNFRIVKGTAVYTANFTPSTTPLTAVSGTSLLTCQSNRFIDNSGNNFTITLSGDVSVSAFGPFVPASSYNSATMGGSIYFDGNGDYLTQTTNAAYGYGTGDFTIEFWLNLSSVAADQTIVSNLTSASSTNPHFYFASSNKRIYYYTANADRITGDVLSPNIWYYIALSRSSGSTKLFINGVQSGLTYADTNNYGSTAPLGIGTYWAGGSPFVTKTLNGYISNLRVVKGTAVYTSNFTPPTAPVAAITGTSLLLNGTNGAIVDASTKNILETAGDAKVSTTVSANGSMYFDGTGDYLLAPSNDTQQLGAGNFTIEMWMRSSSGGTLLTKDNNEFVNYGNLFLSAGPTVYFHCNPNPNSGTGRVVLTSTSTVTTNNWVHIAVSRTGNNWYLFVNGILESTASSSVGFWNTSSPFYVGCNLLRSSPAGFYQGYINNLRVTKGIGRYTTNFTPPTRS